MAKLFNQETSIELYLKAKEPIPPGEEKDVFFDWFVCGLRIFSADFIEYNFDNGEIMMCAGEVERLVNGIRDIIKAGASQPFDFEQQLPRFDFISYETFFELSFIDNGDYEDGTSSMVVDFWLNTPAVISSNYETKRGLSFIVDSTIVERFANELEEEIISLIHGLC